MRCPHVVAVKLMLSAPAAKLQVSPKVTSLATAKVPYPIVCVVPNVALSDTKKLALDPPQEPSAVTKVIVALFVTTPAAAVFHVFVSLVMLFLAYEPPVASDVIAPVSPATDVHNPI